MKIVKTSLEVQYSQEQMFALVADVLSYPEFLPWCNDTKILNQADNLVEASMQVSKGPFQECFTTKNSMSPNTAIEMQLVNGPFKHLEGYWNFAELENLTTKVDFIIEFEFINPVVSAALSPIFNSITSTMVDSFNQRAKQVYG